MNGAQWLVRRLKDGGVDRIFALCGNGLNPLLDACLDLEMTIVDVRNEQAASYMADLHGRMTGSLGVVLVSSGPGHTNALTGLTNSAWDGGPMLLISGCSELTTRGMGHFQELDQVGMADPVCKHTALVSSTEALKSETHNALNAALAPRPGPVHLTIPVDILEARVEDAPRIQTPLTVQTRGAGDDEAVAEAVGLMQGAVRPVIIVGSGAFYSGTWPVLKELAGLTGIPVFSHLWDRGCVEEVIPQYSGPVSTEVNAGAELIAEADVIVTLSARVDFRLTFGRPPFVNTGVRFIRIDADPREIHKFMEGEPGIVGDPRSVVEQLLKEASRRKWDNSRWLERIREKRQASIDFWMTQPKEADAPFSTYTLCKEIKPFLEGQTTFLLDGGNIGRWAHMLFFDRHPSHWFTCGISGVIGWGIPGAIAAKLIRPEEPLLLLSGDGSAGFTLGDIQTAVRFRTPYTAVIAHDSAWGIVSDGQPEGRHAGSELGEIRFDRVAEALGAKGVYIRHLEFASTTVHGASGGPVLRIISFTALL